MKGSKEHYFTLFCPNKQHSFEPLYVFGSSNACFENAAAFSHITPKAAAAFSNITPKAAASFSNITPKAAASFSNITPKALETGYRTSVFHGNTNEQ